MEIKPRHVFLLLGAFVFYVYLVDILKNPHVQNKFRKFVNGTNSTNHTLINWLEGSTNQLAGAVSLGSFAVLNYIPSFMRDPRYFVYSSLVAGGMSAIKYNGWLNLGYFDNDVAVKQKQEGNGDKEETNE